MRKESSQRDMKGLIENVRLGPNGSLSDVLLDGELLSDVYPHRSGARELSAVGRRFEGRGLTLLPGLVDHHVHLGAWLRSRQSHLLRGDDQRAVIESILSFRPDRRGWRVIFGWDHHHDSTAILSTIEEVSGPVAVIHRTGHAVMLNSNAAIGLGVGRTAGIRHDRGIWPRALAETNWQDERRELVNLKHRLLAEGVVGLQDATPYRARAWERRAAISEALSPIRVSFMADPDESFLSATHLKLMSPWSKVTLNRPVAIHAVEPAEVVAATHVIRRTARGDRCRIEHASLCPPDVISLVVASNASVCANPSFLLERAAALRHLCETGEDEMLCPIAELRESGVEVRYGSDAPVTSPGVWHSVVAAMRRGGGMVSFAGKQITLRDSLEGVTSFPLGTSFEQWRGRPADLTLLDLSHLDWQSPPIAAATWIAGEIVHGGNWQRRIS